MNLENVLRLLKNSGFEVYGTDAQYIYLEDPSCILRAFATFAEYAWLALVCVTAVLLFGWGISLIRYQGKSSLSNMATNFRNLFLIFGIVSATGPIMKVIYGDDLFAKGCNTIKVSISEVQQMLDARNAKMSDKDKNNLYEELDIYDTGPGDAPLPEQNTDSPEQPSQSESTPKESNEEPSKLEYVKHDTTFDHGSGKISAISAREHGKNVIYKYADNHEVERSGGTPAWRNNNPGNIVAGKFSNTHGGIGKGGRFAVFPDEQTGMNAIVSLLKTKSYQSKTLAQAISAWAPPSDGNNTPLYQKRVSQATGVSLNTPLKNLNDSQLGEIAKIIRKVEGWKPGKETRL